MPNDMKLMLNFCSCTPGTQNSLPRCSDHRIYIALCRNNLTIVDGILVQGQGGRGEMRFSNRKPGSQSPLQFEMIADKQLKACDSKYFNTITKPCCLPLKIFSA